MIEEMVGYSCFQIILLRPKEREDTNKIKKTTLTPNPSSGMVDIIGTTNILLNTFFISDENKIKIEIPNKDHIRGLFKCSVHCLLIFSFISFLITLNDNSFLFFFLMHTFFCCILVEDSQRLLIVL